MGYEDLEIVNPDSTEAEQATKEDASDVRFCDVSVSTTGILDAACPDMFDRAAAAEAFMHALRWTHCFDLESAYAMHDSCQMQLLI